MKPTYIRSLRTQGNVLAVYNYGLHIAMLDNDFCLYYLNPKSFDILQTKNLNKKQAHKYAKTFAFSAKEHLCFANDGTLLVLRHDYSKHSIQKELKWHVKEIESCVFSSSGSFIASGGADGKTFIFESASYQLIAELKRRPDYINTLAFSYCERLFASTSFDKSVTLYDLRKRNVISAFNLPDVAQIALFFDKNLFVATKQGQTAIIKQHSITYGTQNIPFWATACTATPNEQFALVAGKSDKIVCIDLQTLQIRLKIDLSKSCGVSSLSLANGMLIVAFIDGGVDIFDYDKGSKETDTLLKIRDFDAVSKLKSINPFLALRKDYDKAYDDGWKNILPKIIIALSLNKTNDALAMAEPFLDDEKRKAEFDFYACQRQEVAEFMDAVNKKEICKAYALLSANSYLENLQAYTQLELYWRTIFEKAKKLLEENPSANKTAAMELFGEFLKIESKKSAIASLLSHTSKFKEAELAVKNRDFKTYFKLCVSYKFLESCELYRKVCSLGEALLEKAMKFENLEDYANAKQAYDLLQEFAPFAKEALERKNIVVKKQLFLHAIASNDLKTAFANVCDEIESLNVFKELVNRCEKLLDDALGTNMHALEKKIAPLEGITYWSNRINDLKRAVYIDEISKEFTMLDKSARIEKIKFCIATYGANSALERLCEEYGLQEIVTQK